MGAIARYNLRHFVYHKWDGYTVSELGLKMDKNTWVLEHIVDAKHEDDVQKMLVD